MAKQNVLLMSLTDPSGDPRPFRTIQLCSEMGLKTYIASPPAKKSVEATNIIDTAHWTKGSPNHFCKRLLGVLSLFIPTDKLRDIVDSKRHGLKSFEKAVQGKRFDLIIVEDLYLLPIAQRISPDSKIIFDAREYYPEQLSHNLLWRLTERVNRIRICAKYLSKCDAVLTVSPGLSDAYKKKFYTDCHLVRSVPSYNNTTLSLPSDKVRMVHHGSAIKCRKLENMIDAFLFLDDRFTLDFYLVGEKKYIKELKERASPYPQIRFLDPVEFSSIGRMLSSYDIGLCLLEATTFNLRHCLPNKFFEFIQARLMLAIGPSPDMAELVKEHKCGIVSDSFNAKDLAEKLNVLTTEQILEYKKNSDNAAKILCWETESQKLTAVINGLLDVGERA